MITAPWDKTRVLDREYAIGGLRLRSGDRFVEYVRGEPTSLDGFTVLTSHPILVVGTGDADRFAPTPFQELHRLACLLALAWAEPWQLRSAPRSLGDENELRVPASWPPPEPWYQPDPPLSEDRQALPEVVHHGWAHAAGDRRLQSALTMWHQGMLLHQRHATMASIAYCSVLETFGSALLGDPEAVEDRRAAYAAAVDTWSDPEDRFPLDELFSYWKRSRTVHNARTWADESMFGTLLDVGSERLFGPEPHEGGFGVRALGALRRTSRTALLSAFQGPDGADL